MKSFTDFIIEDSTFTKSSMFPWGATGAGKYKGYKIERGVHGNAWAVTHKKHGFLGHIIAQGPNNPRGNYTSSNGPDWHKTGKDGFNKWHDDHISAFKHIVDLHKS